VKLPKVTGSSTPLLTLALTLFQPAGQPPSTRPADVPFAPTAPAVVDAMLELARVGPNDVVYDLGSGDGRIAIQAALKFGARAVGIELDRVLVERSRRTAADSGVADKVTFIQGDLFSTDISPATVVTLFLWPSVNRQLESKLRLELRPGTRIVSNTFGIGNWRPDQSVRASDGSDVLLWTVPRAPSRAPDVPFVPTPEVVAYEMLKLAGVTDRDVVYDLGSGDGRIPILAAQKYGARAVGVEIDPRLIEISRQVARDAQLTDRVTFVEGDFFTTPFTAATVVTLYLSASVNEKLEPMLRGLGPGTRVVSRQYPIGAWAPARTVRASDGTTLFLWTIGR
jgi:predicted RNA methylase